MQTMDRIPQGDIRLLATELAGELLSSRIPARMAFIWTDGTPRIIPTWFHWTGDEIVMVTYTAGESLRHPATRIAALEQNPSVALVIDTEDAPPRSLTVRGKVRIEYVDGIAPEYAESAKRYLGDEVAAQVMSQMDRPSTAQAKIVLTPEWVGLLDFQSRMPSAQGGV